MNRGILRGFADALGPGLLFRRRDDFQPGPGVQFFFLDKVPFGQPSSSLEVYSNGLLLLPSKYSLVGKALTLATQTVSGQTITIAYSCKEYPQATTFTPGVLWYTSLFGGSDVGNILDINTLSSLYQDTAHTIPVTATGQTVKAIQCQKTGLYATSSTGSVLSFDATNSLYYLTLVSGNLWQMTCASGLLANVPMTLIATASLQGGAHSESLVCIGGSASHSSFQFGNNASAFSVFNLGSGGGSNGTVQSGLGVYIATKGGASPDNYIGYKNNTQIDNTTGITATNITQQTLTMGADFADSFPLVGVFYNCVAINRVITSTERATVTAKAL